MRRFFTLLIVGAMLLPTFVVPTTGAVSDTTGHPYAAGIQYLLDYEVVQGYPDGTFRPDQEVNRAEFLKIVYRSLGTSDDTLQACVAPISADIIGGFRDVSRTAWFAKYVCLAQKQQLIAGYPDGTFRPEATITLPEAAKIILRLMDLAIVPVDQGAPWYENYVAYLTELGSVPGAVDSIAQPLTRGVLAEMLHRLATKTTSSDTTTYQELTGQAAPTTVVNVLPQFASCADWQARVKAQETQHYYPVLYKNMAMDEAVGAVTPSAAEGSATTGARDYSQTNVQVAGVDEADVIKNDGQYIYLVKGNTVRIIRAYEPSSMKEESIIKLEDSSFSPTEIYVANNLLTIIGSTSAAVPIPLVDSPAAKVAASTMPAYYPWYDTKTVVYVYDVTDHSKPQPVRSVSIGGNYSQSRRVGEYLYVVLNSSLPWYRWGAGETSKVENLIPEVWDSVDQKGVPAVTCGDVHYFPGYGYERLLTVAAIPLKSTGKVDRQVVLGSSENIYMNEKALYVAMNRDNWGSLGFYRSWEQETAVYKYNIANGQVTFARQGVVPGQVLNQFSMDEYNDHFRIATTTEHWGTTAERDNGVYILDKDLKLTGQIEGIAPGEKLYSARFLGAKAYLVTFKTVDPFFVVNLANPKAPKIEGELKIPGYSEYLHPYDETHVIGFGREVDESIDADKVHSDSAVYYTAVQGMKISLFDVSDLAHPKEMYKEIIGARGTTSELLSNHKALLFDKEKGLLAFPVTVTEAENNNLSCGSYHYSTCPTGCRAVCVPTSCTKDAYGQICTADCDGDNSCVADSTETKIKTVFSGAYVYKISLDKGFQLVGKVTHYPNDDVFKDAGEYFYGEAGLTIQRIIYIGQYLYTISPDLVKALTFSLSPVNSVKIAP